MKQANYLTEMGIESWDIAHPDQLKGYQPEPINLSEDCMLLFISPYKPEGEIVFMFEKVLKSFKLELSQARHLYPHQLEQLSGHNPEWIWCAGCDADTSRKAEQRFSSNLLDSPLLHHIDGNQQERRKLWQQICRYENKN